MESRGVEEGTLGVCLVREINGAYEKINIVAHREIGSVVVIESFDSILSVLTTMQEFYYCLRLYFLFFLFCNCTWKYLISIVSCFSHCTQLGVRRDTLLKTLPHVAAATATATITVAAFQTLQRVFHRNLHTLLGKGVKQS